MLAVLFAAINADDFPLLGSYRENEPCKDDTPASARVTITRSEINSPMGHCKILNFKREEESFAAEVECSGLAVNELIVNVRFTLGPDETVKVADQDQTYRAVLYRCR
jgi:hypothetical protein